MCPFLHWRFSGDYYTNEWLATPLSGKTDIGEIIISTAKQSAQMLSSSSKVVFPMDPPREYLCWVSLTISLFPSELYT